MGLLQVGQLVLAHGDQIGLAEGDVRGLADGVPQKAVGHLVVAVLGGLGLDGGVVAQHVDRHQHGVQHGQLGDGADLGLLHQGDALGVQADGQVVDSHLVDGLADPIGLRKVGGQGLNVRQEDEGVIVALQAHPVVQAADQVPQVQPAGGAVAGEDTFFCMGMPPSHFLSGPPIRLLHGHPPFQYKKAPSPFGERSLRSKIIPIAARLANIRPRDNGPPPSAPTRARAPSGRPQGPFGPSVPAPFPPPGALCGAVYELTYTFSRVSLIIPPGPRAVKGRLQSSSRPTRRSQKVVALGGCAGR